MLRVPVSEDCFEEGDCMKGHVACEELVRLDVVSVAALGPIGKSYGRSRDTSSTEPHVPCFLDTRSIPISITIEPGHLATR